MFAAAAERLLMKRNRQHFRLLARAHCGGKRRRRRLSAPEIAPDAGKS